MKKLRRVGMKIFFPIVGFGIAFLGIGLLAALPSRDLVPAGWNRAWGGFDIAMGALVIVMWWAARHRKWWAVALVGALNAVQCVDIWFSLNIYYDLGRRPGLLLWAVVVQPVFAWLAWRYVLHYVHPRRGAADPRVAADLPRDYSQTS